MPWSSEKAAGFVLAGVLKGDRELSHVRSRLADALLPALDAWTQRLAQEGSEKTRALRELAMQVRPPLHRADHLPPRARAWLASHVERERGRAYLREAPAPRPGFEPDAGLLAFLERLARTPGEPS